MAHFRKNHRHGAVCANGIAGLMDSGAAGDEG